MKIANAYQTDQSDLVDLGRNLFGEWINLNRINLPIRFVKRQLVDKPSGSYGCGYYSHNYRTIVVDPRACAKPSVGYAQKWSFPGYTSDRTPVGVTAHEYGHAIDFNNDRPSRHKEWLLAVKANKFSSYEPDASEAFAESFRLFLLNPALLEAVCPQRFAFLTDRWEPLHSLYDGKNAAIKTLKAWKASDNILAAATKKLEKARASAN